jgi:type IV pilus assembly protein PilA
MKGSRGAGFSLVELIVVIAIMAVLVGVLAPAYLKYVEKSRKSSDISAIDQVFTAAEATATDLELYVPVKTEFVLNATKGTVEFTIPVWGDDTDKANSSDEHWNKSLIEWKDAANKGDPYKLHSKDWSAGNGIVKGIVKSDGTIAWCLHDGGGVFKDMCDYSEEFASKFES